MRTLHARFLYPLLHDRFVSVFILDGEVVASHYLDLYELLRIKISGAGAHDVAEVTRIAYSALRRAPSSV